MTHNSDQSSGKPLKKRFNRARLRQKMAAKSGLGHRPHGVAVLATPTQERFWFLSQTPEGSAAYTVQSVLAITGAISQAKLAEAVKALPEQHPLLAMVFRATSGGLLLEPSPEAAPVLEQRHVADEPARQAAVEALQQAPFDLAQGPLMRLGLLSVSETDHLLVLTLHHAIADEKTVALIWQGLAAHYGGQPVDGATDQAPDFADFAFWEAGQAAKRAEALRYWKTQLGNSPSLLSLPTKAPRPSVQDHTGAVFTGEITALDLDSLLEAYRLTPNMVFLAVWAQTLAQFSGQDDICISIPVSLRDKPELENIAGPFVNTVVVRLDLDPDQSFAALLSQTRSRVLEAQEHQAVPFDHVVEAVAPARSPAHAPLSQTMLAWHGAADGPAPHFAGCDSRFVRPPRTTAQLDLTLDLRPVGAGFEFSIEYAVALFSQKQISDFASRVVANLQAGLTDPSALLSALPGTLATAAHDQGFYGPQIPLKDQPWAVEAIANSPPEAIAVGRAGRTLSYADLETRANKMAQALRHAGIKCGARVALRLDRSEALVVALLAVMKTGATFVPMDIETPDARVADMLEACAADLLISAEAIGDTPHLVMAEDQWKTEPDMAPETNLEGDDIAYIIHTSGTTGIPKGIEITQDNLRALVVAWGEALTLGAGQVHLQMAAFSFDVCLADIMRALCFGGKLVFATGEERLDGAALSALIGAERITIADFVPATLDMVMAHAERAGKRLDGLKTVLCGSDRWTLDSAQKLRRLTGPHTKILHAYGVSECTVDSLFYQLPDTAEEITALPLGQPIANGTARVLDAGLQPVADGVVGALYLGGAGIGRGYVGQKALTEAAFIPDPFTKGARLYRTGDRARIGPDGNLTLLGRADSQINLRGYRIEPGDIEARLRKAGAAAAAVSLQGGQLVAHVSGAVAPEALRKALLQSLPDYMVPSVIMPMAQLPLTQNGKIDRRALPAVAKPATKAQTAPRTALEQAVATSWAEGLGLSDLGVEAHFFELGGHSMLAVRVGLALAERLGLDIRPRDIFAHPVLEDFAAFLRDECKPALPPITKVDQRTALPLSFSQQQLWLAAQVRGANRAYNMPTELHLEGTLNQDALRAALHAIVARHAPLRTVVTMQEGRPCQHILPPDHEINFKFTDLTKPSESSLAALRLEEVETPFDLAENPPIRAHLVKTASQSHTLLLTLHHIASDGWSTGIFWAAFEQNYKAACVGAPLESAPLDISYADFASWQRRYLAGSPALAPAAFWQDELADAPAVLDLPTDRPRAVPRDFSGDVVPAGLPADITAALEAMGQAQGGTLLAAVLAAWALVLTRISHQDEVVIGLPAANRTQPQTQGMIGFFVNTLAIRINTAQAQRFSDLVQQVAETLKKAQAHQDYPFEKVVETLNPHRNPAYNPVFQVMLAWESEAGEGLALPDLETRFEKSPHTSAKFDLVLGLNAGNGAVSGGLEYATALFDQSTAEMMVASFARVATQMAKDPATLLAALALEAHPDLPTATGPAAAPFVPVALRVFEQARRTPHAPALEMEGAVLSYADMAAQVTALADELAQQGLCAGERAVISLGRSPEMIIAVLAVLHNGAICVPVDPTLPDARRAYILKDAAPKLIVADASHAALFSELAPVVVPHGARAKMAAPRAEVLPDDGCYMLYTSGSTGWPKGVLQTHGMLSNLVSWQNGAAVAGAALPDRVLQFASLGFDVAFQEIFSTLAAGATLVLPCEQTRKDMAALARFIETARVARVYLPFAVLQQLAALEPDYEKPMACEAITAGEAVIMNPALRRFLAALGGACFYNQYGPTETHVVSQHRLICAEMDHWPARPAIGRPIAGNSIYVLDKAGHPLPSGVPGELCLAGAGVAKSYWQQPDLSAERFVNDPFAQPKGRMFKSGDLGYYDPQGHLHFVGRADQQIKLRGFRVEPAEIEAALLSHTAVLDAVVLALPDEKGEQALCAYFTGPARPDDLTPFLAQRLPEYMIPKQWLALDALPINANGKVDRAALARMESARLAPAYSAPEGDVETTIAAIWSDILKIEKIGRESNFFDLGGHSLLAARLVHRINAALGCGLTLSDLLEHPVLHQLAHHAQTTAHVGTTAPETPLQHNPADRFAPFPMTDIQQAYWVGRNADMGLGGVSAHAYEEMRVQALNVERLEAVLNKMIVRHDMLRTIFRPDGTQQVLEDLPYYAINVVDLRGLPEAEQTAHIEDLRRDLSHQVLDAAQWPLFDFTVTMLDDTLSHLHISTDALIVDAASGDLFAREIAMLYADPACDLPAIGVSFRDYILCEEAKKGSAAVQKSRDYWWARLDALPNGPDLPLVATPESMEQPQFVRRDTCIRKPEWDRLKAQAKRHAVTPSGLLLAAFSSVLATWAKSPQFTLSLPLYNRQQIHADINRVIGDFTSVLLCEVDVTAAGNFAELCQNLQAGMWRDMDHARISGIEITRERMRRQGVQQTPFPVVFNSTLIGGGPEESAPADSFEATFGAQKVHTITQTPQVWLDHTIVEVNGDLFFNWDSIDALFPEGLMADMFARYLALLESLADEAAWGMPPLPRALPAPVDKSTIKEGLIHEGFAEMAQKYPENLAIITPTRILDYQTLNAEARGLAAALQQKGVAEGEMVAVMMPPGWEQVVAVLGVLMAGGVYLPLDPDLPENRLNNILERTQTKLVLVQPGQEAAAGGVGFMPVEAGLRGTPRAVTRQPDDLAYVIFTSGSTGEPKGVMIDHGGAFNTIAEINERIGLKPQDRVFALSALNFDLSVYDIFGTLAVGAALVMPAPTQHRDPLHWLDLLAQHNISVWNSVPALLTMLVETAEAEQSKAVQNVRIAMLSGDWIPLALPDSFRALSLDAEVLAMGGATEASIWSIAYPVAKVDANWASIPYGKPLKGQSFYVLDAALNVRPDWATGVLYIGGRGLALGYWGDKARSAASFITHPKTGERLYNTGDLGRRHPDGTLEFLGRVDTQVKVQGYRIELGSIVATLEKHPDITAAAARVFSGAQGGKYIVGYVVSEAKALTEARLRPYLEQHLAAYEIPANIVFLEAMPLSANGKVDRAKLPEPEATADTTDFAPQTPEEKSIQTIVCGILNRETLKPSQNLLTLGATSIDIVRICNAMSAELGQRPKLADFMRQPTLATLISFWRAQAPASPESIPAPEAAPEIIEESDARAAFKQAEHGLRKFAPEAQITELPADTKPENGWVEHRAVRAFDPAPVSLEALAKLLGALSYNSEREGPRYQYASGGGLYPVQTCVFVRPDRVEGMAGGAYGYDPVAHALVELGHAAAIDGDAYDYFVNRPTFESAAFGIYFVYEAQAMHPMYGDHAAAMALIEAGGMGQHLIGAAHGMGLGLCAIGAVQDACVRAAFSLGPSQRVIYSMLGGALLQEEATEVFEI